MPVVTLPYPRTVRNAPLNAAEAAKLILNHRNARVCWPSGAEGLRCCMCGRKPPSDQLFEIIVSAALGASRQRLMAGLRALEEA